MERINAETLDIKEKIVKISRVAKVVKGGRNFRFSVVVVVGDKNGHVGVGMGKATEIPEAVRKGVEDAKKQLIKVPVVHNDTIPHEILGEFGSGKVLMKPAREGTGVIAGGPVRAVLELAGIRNIRTKTIGSNNARNVVNAVMQGLSSLKTAEDYARLRGKTVEDITGRRIQ